MKSTGSGVIVRSDRSFDKGSLELYFCTTSEQLRIHLSEMIIDDVRGDAIDCLASISDMDAGIIGTELLDAKIIDIETSSKFDIRHMSTGSLSWVVDCPVDVGPELLEPGSVVIASSGAVSRAMIPADLSLSCVVVGANQESRDYLMSLGFSLVPDNNSSLMVRRGPTVPLSTPRLPQTISDTATPDMIAWLEDASKALAIGSSVDFSAVRGIIHRLSEGRKAARLKDILHSLYEMPEATLAPWAFEHSSGLIGIVEHRDAAHAQFMSVRDLYYRETMDNPFSHADDIKIACVQGSTRQFQLVACRYVMLAISVGLIEGDPIAIRLMFSNPRAVSVSISQDHSVNSLMMICNNDKLRFIVDLNRNAPDYLGVAIAIASCVDGPTWPVLDIGQLNITETLCHRFSLSTPRRLEERRMASEAMFTQNAVMLTLTCSGQSMAC